MVAVRVGSAAQVLADSEQAAAGFDERQRQALRACKLPTTETGCGYAGKGGWAGGGAESRIELFCATDVVPLSSAAASPVVAHALQTLLLALDVAHDAALERLESMLSLDAGPASFSSLPSGQTVLQFWSDLVAEAWQPPAAAVGDRAMGNGLPPLQQWASTLDTNKLLEYFCTTRNSVLQLALWSCALAPVVRTMESARAGAAVFSAVVAAARALVAQRIIVSPTLRPAAASTGSAAAAASAGGGNGLRLAGMCWGASQLRALALLATSSALSKTTAAATNALDDAGAAGGDDDGAGDGGGDGDDAAVLPDSDGGGGASDERSADAGTLAARRLASAAPWRRVAAALLGSGDNQAAAAASGGDAAETRQMVVWCAAIQLHGAAEAARARAVRPPATKAATASGAESAMAAVAVQDVECASAAEKADRLHALLAAGSGESAPASGAAAASSDLQAAAREQDAAAAESVLALLAARTAGDAGDRVCASVVRALAGARGRSPPQKAGGAAAAGGPDADASAAAAAEAARRRRAAAVLALAGARAASEQAWAWVAPLLQFAEACRGSSDARSAEAAEPRRTSATAAAIPPAPVSGARHEELHQRALELEALVCSVGAQLREAVESVPAFPKEQPTRDFPLAAALAREVRDLVAGCHSGARVRRACRVRKREEQCPHGARRSPCAHLP